MQSIAGTLTSATQLPRRCHSMLSDYNLTMVPQTLTLQSRTDGAGGDAAWHGRWIQWHGQLRMHAALQRSEITCSFNPVTLTGGGSTTMSIVTTAPQYATSRQTGQTPGAGLSLAGRALAALLLLHGARPQTFDSDAAAGRLCRRA